MAARKVVIIGAGCAGLSAAYTLRKQGVEAVVYEASGVVGGRCRTEYEQGFEFYAGAGSTEPQWATTFQYLTELGLLDRVYSIQKQRYGFVRNGRIRTIFLGGSFWEMV
jgi:protoporphyrinogen/coproporphyrinogen III oxidase